MKVQCFQSVGFQISNLALDPYIKADEDLGVTDFAEVRAVQARPTPGLKAPPGFTKFDLLKKGFHKGLIC